ncbi:floral homeotic protein PMADS 2-like [Coffea eugenioides]|uniref:Floral homeotic protein PMADS 2-like n=2 Tax=Coffea TaxID=13442 RepID=E9JTW4_COFAR|nr:floral homeotic protein PMADS 2-like [Coffea arabica]XP_027150624.1 floral homeotic protein PMADS 2-like [Coffea eugenioides]ADU56835.1 MADS-box protein GLO subfamily [Coffea arabica]
MGRGKIEIKRIENSNNRQVTYSKRRTGIMKKAKEITVLCDAKVSLIIFGTSGKMHEYISPSTNLVEMLDAYQRSTGKKLWDAKHENLSNEIDRVKKENDSMQIELRHLKGEDITSLNYKELMILEDALENGLAGLREKQSEIIKMIRKTGEMLEDENKQLQYIWHQQEMANMKGAIGERDDVYQRVRDYPSQMPFAFRVQPMQPNLHERI